MPRPTKGDRDIMVTRPPRAVGDRVRQLSSESGLSISEWIAATLAREVGLPDLAPLPHERLPVRG